MAPLVVVCTDPLELARWLATETLDRVRLLTPRDLVEVSLPAYDEPPPAPEREPVRQRVLRLPMDGPDGALDYAAQAVAQRLAPDPGSVVVLADGLDTAPATARQVQLLRAAGLVVGVDVTRCAWSTDAGTWLTGPTGVRRVPGSWDHRTRGTELASVVAMLLDGHDDAPVRRWVDELLASGTSPGPGAWVAPLQAMYVDALARTDQPTPAGHA